VVVQLGVGEHRDLRGQLQQRAVGLVGLDDDPFPLPPAGVGLRAAQLAADHVARIHAARRERVHQHRGSRGLAVGSGYGERPSQHGELSEEIGAVQLPAAGRSPLGVVARDRRRIDYLGARRHVPGRVADCRLDPVLAQPLGIGGLATIRARHVRAERAGDERQPAHPGAADADEMQPAAGPVVHDHAFERIRPSLDGPGVPVHKDRLSRSCSGSLAIFSSSATSCASPGSRASRVCSGPRCRSRLKRAHE